MRSKGWEWKTAVLCVLLVAAAFLGVAWTRGALPRPPAGPPGAPWREAR